MTGDEIPARPRKGRGAAGNPDGRFESLTHAAEDDGWFQAPDEGRLSTTLQPDTAKSVISRNDSPDVGFSQSINPYRGCEHGCVYCFARPTHSWLGLSAGLDFETRLFYKADAARLLQGELRKPGYRCSPIALGINTDAYQPAERKLRITRSILEVLSAFGHPLTIVTKSGLVARDIDLLAPMAEKNLVKVMFSITTLDSALSRRMEPRTSAPQRKLQAMKCLTGAGVPVGVMFAPVIPALNDAELEAVLAAAREAGAESAGYVLLRLPHEVKDLFREWLTNHYPLKARHVMSVIRNLRGGRDYNAEFGERMRGRGPFADLLERRFKLACQRLGLNQKRRELNCDLFAPPAQAGDQMALF